MWSLIIPPLREWDIKYLRNAPLSRKMHHIITFSVWVALLVFGLIIALWTGYDNYKKTSEDAKTMAQLAARSNFAALRFDDKEEAFKQLQIFSKIPSVVSLRLYSNVSRGTIQSGASQAFTSYPRSAAEEPVRVDKNHAIDWSTKDIQVYELIIEDDEVLGSVILTLSLSPIWQSFLVSSLIAIMAIGVALLVVKSLSHRLQSIVVTPILRLRSSMKDVEERLDYSGKVAVYSKDEVGELAQGFNNMLDKIHLEDQKLEQLVVERTQELEIAKAKAEKSNNAKRQFLANMSHEIRTPLTGLIGVSELLSETDATREQKNLIAMISSSSSALLHIINDVLDFSKIESGMLQLENVPYTPFKSARQVVDLFTAQATDKALSISIEHRGYESIEDVRIKGDPHRLKQILSNLVSNAIKFTHDGSIRVVMEPSATKPQEASHTRYRISVQDTGIGISAQGQEKLFNSFSQADESMARKFGGSGLGLVISRQLAELMGGAVGFTSAPGQGSTFWVEIEGESVSNSQANSIGSASAQKADGAPVDWRVLVAEDNDVNRKILETVLKGVGAEVISTINGIEAVEKFKAQEFDIVLMDVQMPEMDGIEATRQIRALELAGGMVRTPIIALTANALADDKANCIAAGMDDYLTKPYMRKQMIQCIDKHIKAKRGGA